jgi:hypothetical protein
VITNEHKNKNGQSSNGSVLYKPTGTVQISNRFTLIERRLLNVLIWHAQQKQGGKDSSINIDAEYWIRVADLLRLLGLAKSHNVDVIKDAVRELTGTIIEWNIFGQDRTAEWGVCTFLSFGILKGGVLYYRLNPMISKEVYRPRLYAKMQLLMQSRVRRRYALVLYEFFVDALSRNKADALQIQAPLQDIYLLLGVQLEMEFKFFKRDILTPSLKEISRQTDLDSVVETVKQGKKITELRFSVTKKKAFQLPLDLEGVKHTELWESENPIEPAGIGAAISSEGNPCYEALVKLNVSPAVAAELIERHDSSRILANINYVISRKDLGNPIANLSGYIVRAIEEDFRANVVFSNGKASKVKDQARLNAEKAESSEKIRTDWKRFRGERIRFYFQQLSPSAQEQEKARFIERIRKEDEMAYHLYERSGLRNKIVQALFYGGLEFLLREPDELDFDIYKSMKKDVNDAK